MGTVKVQNKIFYGTDINVAKKSEFFFIQTVLFRKLLPASLQLFVYAKLVPNPWPL